MAMWTPVQVKHAEYFYGGSYRRTSERTSWPDLIPIPRAPSHATDLLPKRDLSSRAYVPSFAKTQSVRTMRRVASAGDIPAHPGCISAHESTRGVVKPRTFLPSRAAESSSSWMLAKAAAARCAAREQAKEPKPSAVDQTAFEDGKVSSIAPQPTKLKAGAIAATTPEASTPLDLKPSKTRTSAVSREGTANSPGSTGHIPELSSVQAGNQSRMRETTSCESWRNGTKHAEVLKNGLPSLAPHEDGGRRKSGGAARKHRTMATDYTMMRSGPEWAAARQRAMAASLPGKIDRWDAARRISHEGHRTGAAAWPGHAEAAAAQAGADIAKAHAAELSKEAHIAQEAVEKWEKEALEAEVACEAAAAAHSICRDQVAVATSNAAVARAEVAEVKQRLNIAAASAVQANKDAVDSAHDLSVKEERAIKAAAKAAAAIESVLAHSAGVMEERGSSVRRARFMNSLRSSICRFKAGAPDLAGRSTNMPSVDFVNAAFKSRSTHVT